MWIRKIHRDSVRVSPFTTIDKAATCVARSALTMPTETPQSCQTVGKADPLEEKGVEHWSQLRVASWDQLQDRLDLSKSR